MTEDSRPDAVRRVVSSIFSAFTLRVAGLVLSAASLGGISRLVTMDEYGDYLLSLSVVTLGNCIAGLGLPTAIVRRLADDSQSPEDRGQTIVAAGIVTLMSGVVVGAACAAARGWLHRPDSAAAGFHWQSFCLGGWIVVSSLTLFLGETFRGLRMIVLAGIFSGVSSPLLLCLSLLRLYGRGVETSVQEVLALTVASYGTTLVLGLLVLGAISAPRGVAWPSGVSSLWRLAPELLRESAPMMVVAVCTLILGQLDLWIVGSYCPLSETAVYGGTARLMALLALPLAAVNLTIPPRIAAMHYANRGADVERMLRSTATMAAWAGLLLTIVVLVGAEAILSGLFGPGFERGALVLRCLAIGQLIVNWSGSPGFALLMTGQRQWAMYVGLLTVVYVATLSVWLTPRYGVTAAALIATSGIVLHRMMLIAIAWRVLRLWCPAYAWPPREMWAVVRSGGSVSVGGGWRGEAG